MKIKHDSWWLKWAYLLSSEYDKPEAGMIINLCPLFWRIVLLTPVKCALIFVFSPLIILLGAIFLVQQGFSWLWRRSDDKREKFGEKVDVIGDKYINPVFEGARAIYKRFCPLVKVE